MRTRASLIGLGLALMAMSAAAQTGTVPLDAGTPPSGLTNSNITELNGNVGIGTTNPNATLQVNGGAQWSGSNFGTNLLISGTRNNALGFLDFQGNNPWAIVDQWLGQAWGNALVFDAMPPLGNTTATPTNVLTLTPSGKVGIGTDLPSQSLEVNGNALVDGALMVGANGIVFPNGTTQTMAFNPTTNLSFSGVTANTVPTVTISSNPNNGGCDGCVWPALQVNALAAIPGSTNVGLSVNVGGGGQGNYAALFNGGNVGIGTTSPAYKLDVAGQIHSSTGGYVFPDGTTQTTAFIPANCGADYAESVGVSGDRTKYEPGDLLVIDPDNPGRFLKSNQAYSSMVAGVYSTQPGFVGRKHAATDPASKDEVPMAMVGRVPTKVSAENGPIHVGDLLVTSSTMGYAMKGTDRSQMLGAVVGKALGSLDSGTGVIEVLVTLQ